MIAIVVLSDFDRYEKILSIDNRQKMIKNRLIDQKLSLKKLEVGTIALHQSLSNPLKVSPPPIHPYCSLERKRTILGS